MYYRCSQLKMPKYDLLDPMQLADSVSRGTADPLNKAQQGPSRSWTAPELPHASCSPSALPGLLRQATGKLMNAMTCAVSPTP